MSLIQRIDALLPQTQCGKCGHPGCKPYAQGIAAGEPINRCPPGGQETIAALAELLQVPPLALDTTRGAAPAQVAYIREAECIGCTKCIQACPVDAILGAAKLMHTVLVDECTGCDLCVAPCPVDCIELRPLPAGGIIAVVAGHAHDDAQRLARASKRDRARRRHEQRGARLLRDSQRRAAEREARQALARPAAPSPVLSAIERIKAQKANANDAALKQAKIAVAMNRAQLHKSHKAFGSPPTAEQYARLSQLLQELETAETLLQRLQGASTDSSGPGTA